MNIHRYIHVWDINEDRLVDSISINSLPFEIIKNAFQALDDDPEYYAVYFINPIQYEWLSQYISELAHYPLGLYEFTLEAEQ